MADDESAFLATIRAAPADRTARLVYADWLEEQGDPRHELVRVCEAMRDEPPWGDRYWALKARRNELCAHAPLEWLEATGYDGSYYDPVFRAGVPDDWRGRWRLIREFTERWHGVAVPDVGGQQDVIAAEEARLGVELPPSVREFVAYMHDVRDSGTAGTPRQTPELFCSAHYQLGHMVNPGGISLIEFEHSDAVVGVGRADLARSDPPTGYFRLSESDQDESYGSPRGTLCEPSVSLSIFNDLLTELPAAGRADTSFINLNDMLTKLARDLPIHVRFDDADVFEGDEMLILVRGPRTPGGRPFRRQVHGIVRRSIPPESIPSYLFHVHRYRVEQADRRRRLWQSVVRRAATQAQEAAALRLEAEEVDTRWLHGEEPPDDGEGIAF